MVKEIYPFVQSLTDHPLSAVHDYLRHSWLATIPGRRCYIQTIYTNTYLLVRSRINEICTEEVKDFMDINPI